MNWPPVRTPRASAISATPTTRAIGCALCVCFQRAGDYLDGATDEEAKRPEFRLEHAQTDGNLAVLYGNRSLLADDENLYCPQQAADLYLQAFAALEVLQKEERIGRVARMELARVYTNYGTFLVNNPERGDGAALLSKANTLLVELNKQNPGVADVRVYVGAQSCQ